MKRDKINDAYHGAVEVYESSVASEPHMWIHTHGGMLTAFGGTNEGYAHLNREQARELRNKLNEFLDEPATGGGGVLSITELVYESYLHAMRSGFHDDAPASADSPRGREWLASKLALIHSEVSEALEETRENDNPLKAYHRLDGKPEGFGAELADIVIRVADLAGATGTSLEFHIEEKLQFNRSRPPKHDKHF